MKILIDMNLSPAWVDVFSAAGHEAIHWASVGSPCAADSELMAYARKRQMVVITHDLDFSALLYATKATGPSVIQVRAHDVSPSNLEVVVIPAIEQLKDVLAAGALVTIEPGRKRLRVLPLK